MEPLNVLLDKQQNGFYIESIVAKGELNYLEATTLFLEENSIPESLFSRYIPTGIVDKIRNEAIDDKLLRPSVARTQKTNTLDFLL
ncbi:late promoter transcriptional regulator [Pectobacterium bacteriophage PM2]|uniref:Late transcription coactivator n=1 Tax=Pectobacterium bacteriophage PM2 TaxID=1429794 RepID=A0A0A0PZQ5_9CAUD|nr:late promoter transcriptional regulator [Pectobacterium bacteriophage PM2]AHY25229.1 late promoter transcription accessory protein [Pectobacterium bacteriophage PM2]